MILSSKKNKSALFLLATTLSIFLSGCNSWECDSGYRKVNDQAYADFAGQICLVTSRKNIDFRMEDQSLMRCLPQGFSRSPSDNNRHGLGLCFRVDVLTGQFITKTILTQECTAPCELCQGTDTQCTSCISTSPTPLVYQNKCIATCPARTYKDTPGSCQDCHPNCEVCTGSSNNQCSVCKYGNFISGSTCSPCAPPCTTCLGSSTNCVLCASSVPFLYEGLCHQGCPSGSYRTSSTKCEDCDPNCATCLGSASTCTSCHPSCDSLLYNGRCYNTCPVGTYQNSAQTCATCSSACKTCSGSASTCTSCHSSTPFLYNGDCYISCPSESFQDSENTCEACSSSCAECSGNADACTSCPPSLPILLNDECYSSCPSGYYSSDTPNVCEECPSYCVGSCKQAQGSEILCNKCSQAGAVFYQGACYFKCPPGSYQTSLERCESCPSLCATCTGVDTCVTCLNSAYLYEGTCVSVCPVGYFASSGVCSKCSTNCETCSGTSSQCTSCSGLNRYLYNGTCVPGCPPRTFSRDFVCQDL